MPTKKPMKQVPRRPGPKSVKPAASRAPTPKTATSAKSGAAKPARVTGASAMPAAATAKAPAARRTLAEVMRTLEKAGSEQARKTYARHGAKGPMFGVLFGDLYKLMKDIDVDHEIARQLWATGNVDARNLAMKIADPQA